MKRAILLALSIKRATLLALGIKRATLLALGIKQAILQLALSIKRATLLALSIKRDLLMNDVDPTDKILQVVYGRLLIATGMRARRLSDDIGTVDKMAKGLQVYGDGILRMHGRFAALATEPQFYE